jgi:Na+/proline symporter
MPDKGTTKKLTKVGGGEASTASAGKVTQPFVPSDQSRSKAITLRIFSIISWILAIGAEVVAIVLLRRPPIEMLWLIVLIAVDLAFAIVGSLLWKKANRLDPASQKDRFRFFLQNQLGAIISIIAFLPLVILIFTNKDMNGKQKGIVGAIAVIALLVAGVVGVDFNPPSQEQYAEQTARVESLTGANSVFWTKSGTSYHLYSDCSYINTVRTSEIFQGTVAQARELKNITDLCDRCASRAEKERGLETGSLNASEGNKK